MTVSIAELLTSVLDESIDHDTGEFHWDQFFPKWFREHGTPAFFLFKRNLGVTNVQYVELLTLIRQHSANLSTYAELPVPQFQTAEQIKTMTQDVIGSVLDVSQVERRAALRRFAETYGEVFCALHAVDMFFSSCAIFCPPGRKVDLERICAEAGYIHSVGKSVFIRNIKKARRADLEQSIESHLANMSRREPIPFVAYSHEDFSEFDKESKDQITRGIDGTKLYVEKMSMGSARLSQVLKDIEQRFENRLKVPAAGSYKMEHAFTSKSTLWLIGDRSVAPISPTNPGADRYYICYEQLAKSEDPFFFFDENKPAWKSHTTMPHSLTAALLNAMRPLPAGSTICDPFGGSGTTWFETKRIGLPVKIACGDLSPLSRQMVADNAAFFSMSSGELTSLQAALRSPQQDAGQIALDIGGEQSSGGLEYDLALASLERLKQQQPDEDQEYRIDHSFLSELSRASRLTRLFFYLALRAQLRFQAGFQRRALNFEKAFEKSTKELVDQIQKLIEWKRLAESDEVARRGGFIVAAGTYSVKVLPELPQILSTMEALLDAEIYVGSAVDLPEQEYDAILCDPPYGFNTKEDRDELTMLYQQFFEAAIRALRPNGQLIICLPAESYTGRDLPYCTNSKLIVRQVLSIADRLGKEVYTPGHAVPHRALAAPYYWEAERALRRVILHFRFRPAI